MPYGRGGAGNIQRVEETNKRISDDLEGNRPAAEESSIGKLSEQAAAETKSSSTQQYAYTGRGGAGNWYSPQELSESGIFSSTTEPTSNPSEAPARVIGEPRYTGRGGVGNYVLNAEEEEQARRVTEQKEIELKEWVERDVEAGLAAPDKAHVRSKNPSGGTNEVP